MLRNWGTTGWFFSQRLPQAEVDPALLKPGGAAPNRAADGGRGDCGGHCLGGDVGESQRWGPDFDG